MNAVLSASPPHPEAFIRAVSRCAAEMLYDVLHIERETPGLVLDPSDRQCIVDLCTMLVEAKRELVAEANELTRLIDDGGVDAQGVSVRIDRIEQLLLESAGKLHAVVLHLDDVSRATIQAGPAYLLVADSATNIAKASKAMTDAAAAWRASCWARQETCA